jgi:hypothetical protein
VEPGDLGLAEAVLTVTDHLGNTWLCGALLGPLQRGDERKNWSDMISCDPKIISCRVATDATT